MFGLIINEGSLRSAEDAMVRGVLDKLRTAVREETRGLEQDLEGITRMAVPGRLWRAWKSETFPRHGGLARNPGGEVYVSGGARSQGAMTFATQTGRIRPKNDYWLAIPTPAAGSRGRGFNLTPGEWERRTGQKLTFIYRPGRASLLVAKGTLNQRTGTYRELTARRSKASQRRGFTRGEATVIIFVLLPYVDFRPAFSVERLHQRREQMLAARIEGMLDEGRI